jgi:hypothetical protein
MPSDGWSVFDLDGTLIGVNSFREIARRSLRIMIRKGLFRSFSVLLGYYGLRRLGVYTHLEFKKKVIRLFESCFGEDMKSAIATSIFHQHLNSQVYQRYLAMDDCLVSTACPYAFVSRMPLKKGGIVISSCHPEQGLPSEDNFKQGKVDNLRAFWKTDRIQIDCLYTDSEDDRPLMDCAERVYMVRDGIPVQVK